MNRKLSFKLIKFNCLLKLMKKFFLAWQFVFTIVVSFLGLVLILIVTYIIIRKQRSKKKNFHEKAISDNSFSVNKV